MARAGIGTSTIGRSRNSRGEPFWIGGVSLMPDFAWRCFSCGLENPPYTEVCRSCYQPPSSASFEAIEVGRKSKEARWRSCPTCGLEVGASDMDDVRCLGCGSRLKRSGNRWFAVQSPQKFLRGYSILLAGIAALTTIHFLSGAGAFDWAARAAVGLLGLASLWGVADGLACRAISVKGSVVTWRETPIFFVIVLAVFVAIGGWLVYASLFNEFVSD